MIREPCGSFRELEALDAIAGIAGKLTVFNGTKGLMNGLVRLRN